MRISSRKWFDGLGVFASVACAFHCLLLPVILVALPFSGLAFIVSETGERVMILVTVLIACISLLPAYFVEHRKFRTILMAGAGLTLLIVTHLFFEDSLLLKIILVSTGALLVASAHFLNVYLCKQCAECKE